MCMCKAHEILRRSIMNNKSSREIKMVITFPLNIWFKRITYQDTRNWIRRLFANSKGHNFWLECMIVARDVWRRLKLNNGSAREIQMIITFHSDVWFRHIIYWDARNWTRKLLTNSNDHKFWLGCIFPRDVQFRLIIYRDARIWTQQLSADSNAITFDSGVWLRPIMYGDTWNWTMEALEKFKWS